MLHYYLFHIHRPLYCLVSMHGSEYVIISNFLSANSHAFSMRSVACSETVPLRLSIMYRQNSISACNMFSSVCIAALSTNSVFDGRTLGVSDDLRLTNVDNQLTEVDG